MWLDNLRYFNFVEVLRDKNQQFVECLMADRPTASTSRAGRPRTRSVHLPTCIPVVFKAAKPRAKSVYKAKVKGNSKKRLGKTTIVISSDSETSLGEVDFPNLPIQNQPLDLPAEEQEQPNQPLDFPAEEPKQLNNPNHLPGNPPIPMVNQHLNWSHFKPDFSRKPEEDAEVHLLRTNDWMNTHDFPNDQKVRRFYLTLLGEARLW